MSKYAYSPMPTPYERPTTEEDGAMVDHLVPALSSVLDWEQRARTAEARVAELEAEAGNGRSRSEQRDRPGRGASWPFSWERTRENVAIYNEGYSNGRREALDEHERHAKLYAEVKVVAAELPPSAGPRLSEDPAACSITFGRGLCSSGKYRYDTRPAADRAQRATLRKKHERLNVYRCDRCHGWHLGHPERAR